jgi:two-component system sensor histidine kinase TctE
VGLASRLELERDGDLAVHMPPTAAQPLQHLEDSDALLYAVFDAHGHPVAGLPELKALAQVGVGQTQPVFHNDTLSGAALRVATYAYAGPEGHGTIVVAESLRKRQRATQRLTRSTAWINLLMVTFTLTTVYFAVRHALRPLNALSQQFAQREAKDLSPLSLDRVPGEARPLVVAANQLMGRLQESARSQQVFLSNTAHQLRTPLAGLQTQLELLCDGLPAAAQARVANLLDAVQRMGHLTHQMLALARAAPNAQSVHEPRPVDLCLLLEEVASSCLDRALARQIDLGFEPVAATVMGSHWMLRELLMNLVDNAIAYTPVGGRVTVSCGLMPEGGQPFLAVEDSGPGIAPLERDKVFERFYRAAGTATPGTGLGLAIVRETADQHSARITLDDGPGGQGTRIQVVFPLGPLGGQDIP